MNRIYVISTAILLFLSNLSAEAGIRVVSDIDDTLKITDVGSTPQAVWNGLFTSSAFTGTSELYRTLSTSRGYQFEYLTGAPEYLKFRVKKFLKKNNFPVGKIHLRPAVGSGGTKVYKIKKLKTIFEKNPDDQFILIGDDTQYDFEAYDDLYRTFPDRILAIYIRKVKNQPLPPSAYSFLTAFDIARTEYLMGRLETVEAAPTALSILSEKRNRKILPRFNYCPSNPNFIFMDPKMKEWDSLIRARVEDICQARNLPFEMD